MFKTNASLNKCIVCENRSCLFQIVVINYYCGSRIVEQTLIFGTEMTLFYKHYQLCLASWSCASLIATEMKMYSKFILKIVFCDVCELFRISFGVVIYFLARKKIPKYD